MKIVMEPSSAVPLATILKNRDVFAGKRVGVIITGGNVDLEQAALEHQLRPRPEPLRRSNKMNAQTGFEKLEVGYDIPALPGMDEADIQTPCLVLDLDALERNIKKMGDYAKAHGMRHRVHGKMHKSVDVAKLQERLGGAVGVCCQKVSEAEVFARGGIKDVLVSNQVRDPAKIDRWRSCRNSVPAPSSASMTSPMWPNCRQRAVTRTAPRSRSWSRSTAARAAAA